jgi:hypothetical protein
MRQCQQSPCLILFERICIDLFLQSAIILSRLPLKRDFPVYITNLLHRIFTVIGFIKDLTTEHNYQRYKLILFVYWLKYQSNYHE